MRNDRCSASKNIAAEVFGCYRISEQTELMETFDRISNASQRLGAEADELSSLLHDLENQLGRFLTK
ncbi:MAG: hypothetical protein WA705_17725 [Candidatus Ozemobacteraceae bacterium]